MATMGLHNAQYQSASESDLTNNMDELDSRESRPLLHCDDTLILAGIISRHHHNSVAVVMHVSYPRSSTHRPPPTAHYQSFQLFFPSKVPSHFFFKNVFYSAVFTI